MIEQLQGTARDAVVAMEEGQTQTSSSVEYATAAGETLESIIQAVASITQMNAQIAYAMDEQQKTAESINANISSISEAADQVASASEQATVNASKVVERAEELNQAISGFRL